jgi:hypothetical protein
MRERAIEFYEEKKFVVKLVPDLDLRQEFFM